MLLEYRKTILKALKDVSDSLAAYKEARERREEQTALVVSAVDAVRLAKLRYSGGNTSYLEALTTDTNLYDAQLQLTQIQEQEGASLVQLYAALGGGWQYSSPSFFIRRTENDGAKWRDRDELTHS